MPLPQAGKAHRAAVHHRHFVAGRGVIVERCWRRTNARARKEAALIFGKEVYFAHSVSVSSTALLVIS